MESIQLINNFESFPGISVFKMMLPVLCIADECIC